MNIERIQSAAIESQTRNPEVAVFPPGSLTPEETSNHVIDLLQQIYVNHALTHDPQQLIEDIRSGNVLTWLAFDSEKAVATASLIKQDEAWELGRAVALKRGSGIGKLTMLKRILHHIENHDDTPLVAEVRVADDFMGIPSGMATQKIAFDLVGLAPHAIAPLFSHGDPVRNEPFALSGSHIEPSKTISEQVGEAINNRSAHGVVTGVRVEREEPFRLVVPDQQGEPVENQIREAEHFLGCTLFAVEATDTNMPLIGSLAGNENLVVCGVDHKFGLSGRPVVFVATLGKDVLLAPARLSSALPKEVRVDAQEIANKFEKKGLK